MLEGGGDGARYSVCLLYPVDFMLIFSCHTVKFVRSQVWVVRGNVIDVERRDIGQKIAPKDQVGLVETDLGPAGSHTHEIHMITMVTGTRHHLWIDSDHILIPMTEGHHHLEILTTEIEILMQDHLPSTMGEGNYHVIANF